MYIVRHRIGPFISFVSHRPCKIFCVWFRELADVTIAATYTGSYHQQPKSSIHFAIQRPMECLTNYNTYYITSEEIKKRLMKMIFDCKNVLRFAILLLTVSLIPAICLVMQSENLIFVFESYLWFS